VSFAVLLHSALTHTATAAPSSAGAAHAADSRSRRSTTGTTMPATAPLGSAPLAMAGGASVGEGEVLPVGGGVPVREGVGVRGGVAVGDGVSEGVRGGVAAGVPVPVGEPELLAVSVLEGDVEGVADGVVEGEKDGEGAGAGAFTQKRSRGTFPGPVSTGYQLRVSALVSAFTDTYAPPVCVAPAKLLTPHATTPRAVSAEDSTTQYRALAARLHPLNWAVTKDASASVEVTERLPGVAVQKGSHGRNSAGQE